MENVRYTQIEWYNELLWPHHLAPMVVIYLYPLCTLLYIKLNQASI